MGTVLGGVGKGVEAFLASLAPFFGVIFGGLYLDSPLEGLLEAQGLVWGRFSEGFSLVYDRLGWGFGSVLGDQSK